MDLIQCELPFAVDSLRHVPLIPSSHVCATWGSVKN